MVLEKCQIGKKILSLRKQNNLTQEQLADAIGISVPAVSKWEHGKTLPDVMLLPSLARVLHTDINDLFSYQENLTEQEIRQMMRDIMETCKSKGFSKGMEKVFGLLKEYPNSDYLKLEVAISVERCAFAALEGFSEEEYKKWMEQSVLLFDEIYHKENVEEDIREAAFAGLISRYIQEGRLEEAESLLSNSTKRAFDGSRMLPIIYFQQEKYHRAKESIQKNLLLDIQNLMCEIRMLFHISVKKEEYEKSLQYAQTYYQIGTKIFLLPSYPSELLTEAWILRNDVDKALGYFKDYVEEILFAAEHIHSSIYFDSIADSIVLWSNQSEDQIKKGMYRAIGENPVYRPLLETKQGRNVWERLSN